MVRKSSFVLVIGAVASPASATLVLYEPFNYGPAGTEISTADGSGGWLKVPSATTLEPTMGTGSLPYPALPFTPTGNKVVGSGPGTGVLASSTLAIPGQPYLRTESPTLYYSMLLDVTDITGLATTAAGAFIAGFRNNTSTGGLAGFEAGAALLMRRTSSTATTYNLGVGLTQENADRVYDLATTYDSTTADPLLVVLSYQFVNGGSDVAKLWVNPDPTMTEAANSAALKANRTSPDRHGIGNSSATEESANARITNFFFRNNGTAPEAWEADELRIATSWEGLWTTTAPGIWLGGTGNWSDPQMWSNNIVPASNTLAVRIDNGNAAASVVTLDQDRSVRSVNVDAGDTLNVPAAQTLTLLSPLTVGGIVNNSGNINTAGITIPGGELRYDGGVITNTGPINLSGGGKLLIAAGGNKVVKASTLSVSTTSTINLADNKMVVASGTIGTATAGVYNGLSGSIQRGYNFGAWDAAGIITSMPDALGGITTVAIATGEQIRGLGPTDTDTWAGQTINGQSIILMYTYAGDANLDGQIDAGDYGILDAFIQIEGATGYANGDFNYDGFIDPADYGTIDNSIQFQGPPIPTSGTSAAMTVAVPEPAGALSAAAAALLLGRRRRRRARHSE